MPHSSQLGAFVLGNAQLGNTDPLPAPLVIDGSGTGPLVIAIAAMVTGAHLGPNTPAAGGGAVVGRGWWWFGPAGPTALFAQFRELQSSLDSSNDS